MMRIGNKQGGWCRSKKCYFALSSCVEVVDLKEFPTLPHIILLCVHVMTVGMMDFENVQAEHCGESNRNDGCWECLSILLHVL